MIVMPSGNRVVLFLPGQHANSVRVTKPFEVTIKMLAADSYIASVIDVNLNASGDTSDEAAENLLDIITGWYRVLESKLPQMLGPEPTQQWNFMQKHFRPMIGKQ